MTHLWTSVLCTSGALLAAGLFLWQSRRRRSHFPSSVVVDSPPHAEWRLGDKQISPYKDAGYVAYDPADLTGAQCYPLVISGVVPRPIAFVSSLSIDGVGNLAPFSYFGAVAHDPPCLAVSICRSAQRGGNPKDTAQNILDTKEFVVNIISEWFVESANYTCSPFNAEINEMEITHLTPVPSTKVKPPRVDESALQMECRLKHHYDILNRSDAVHATVFIGEVVMFHVNRAVLTTTPSGKAAIDFLKFQPMSRLGGNTYGRVTSIFDLPRPDRTV